ncbi:GtrA family protein [Streptomyces sp. NPDC059009]|uniref:GtrA family protein n=1 Tax=Streptomyces sp. NPDC059009 TaxID=3346694 RepID=UPI00368A497F
MNRTAHDSTTQDSASNAGTSRAGTPSACSSFVRFVVCGGGVGLASSALVALLADVMPFALANALITVVSTVLATELHARFTFGTGPSQVRTRRWGLRCGLRHHLQSAGTAAAAYVVTTIAVLALHAVVSAPGVALEQSVYLSASALAGIGRFLALRLYVFAAGRRTNGVVAVALPTAPTTPARRELLTTAS